MFPLSDGLSTRRLPIVNVSLIVANFAVWLFYELPHLGASISHASFYPCSVNGSCHGPEPWEISWITAMFMHGSWDHILGNMHAHLGFWFLYQLFEANFGIFGARAHGGGVAFFAHGGGILFGVAVAALLTNSGRVGAGGGLALRAPA
jgi:membrane associated rhomboid family serine protease